MRTLRWLPVDWRIFLIVALNGAVVAILAGMVISGAGVLIGRWDEVRRVHADDRFLVGMERDIARLQALVHRYMNTPSGETLSLLDSRRVALLREMEAFRASDPRVVAEFARLAGASRRFLASFDAVRDVSDDLSRAHELVILRRGPEIERMLAALGDGGDGTSPVVRETTLARGALFDALMGFDAHFHSGEPAAAARAATHFQLLRRELERLRGLTDDPRHHVSIDAMSARVEEMERALSAATFTLERRTRLVVEEIDGRQAGMADVIGGMIDDGRRRLDDAERAFSDAITRMAWQLGLVAVVFLSLSAAVSWLIGRSVSRPLGALGEVMRAFAAGDYDREVRDADVNDEIGAMARTLAVFRENARARRRVEVERDNQERRWRMMLETSPVGVSIIRVRDLLRVYTNPKYDALFGLPAGVDALSWSLGDSFVRVEDVATLVRAFSEHGVISGWEVERKRHDGTRWWCLLDIRSLEYRSEDCYIVWHYDVTDRMRSAREVLQAKERAEAALSELRDAQETLVQSEKMAALGSLVAGIAHEINTPVGIAVTAASHLADESLDVERRFEDGSLRRSDLARYLSLCREASQRVLSNAFRAAELIQSFKQVAVDQTHDDRRVFQLDRYLREVATSLGPQLKPGGHTLSIECPPTVEVDGMPGALAQVVTNLIVNSAVHGYPDGRAGSLSIVATEERGARDALEGGDAVGRGEGYENGDWIRLVYRDDGVGIAPDILPHIFDPFFTTNRAGGGSGLGLNILFNIVRRKLRGNVIAESPAEGGVVFTITFPRVVSAEPTSSSGPEPFDS